MNFDELKDSWAMESVLGGALPAPEAGRATSAISRIRKNMRQEFGWTIFGYAATLAYILVVASQHVSMLLLFASVFMFVPAGYYFSRFFFFYRRTARYDMGLRKTLRKFVYEMELNMEVYKVYSFCVTPMACLLWLALMDTFGNMGLVNLFFCSNSPLSRGILWWLITLAVAQVIAAFVQHLHVRLQYGRYVAELKRTLDDLEGED